MPPRGADLGSGFGQAGSSALCSGPLERLLTEEGQRRLAGAPELVFRVLAEVDGTLQLIEGVDLSAHELAQDNESQNLSTWNALAPDVGRMLAAIRSTSQTLRNLFPPPEDSDGPDSADLELAFDFEMEPMDASVRDRALDDAMEDDAAPGAVHGLLDMLDADIRRFGERMRDPQFMADRWMLLGELHELKGNASNCLDAVVSAVVQPHVAGSLHRVLRRHTTATDRAIRLRSAVRDLWFDVERLKGALHQGQADGATVVRHLRDRLDRWSERPAYADLRPIDKRELIEVRRWAARGEGVQARTRLEDLVRFLEVMEGVNHRERLLDHDREQSEVVLMLIESEVPPAELWPAAVRLYGRDVQLDRMLRAWKRGQVPDPAALEERVRAVASDLGFRAAAGYGPRA